MDYSHLVSIVLTGIQHHVESRLNDVVSVEYCHGRVMIHEVVLSGDRETPRENHPTGAARLEVNGGLLSTLSGNEHDDRLGLLDYCRSGFSSYCVKAFPGCQCRCYRSMQWMGVLNVNGIFTCLDA